MKGLLIAEKDNIFNKVNTSVTFEISEEVQIDVGSMTNNEITIAEDSNGASLLLEDYMLKNIHKENIVVVNNTKNKVFYNWNEIHVQKGDDLTFYFNPSRTKFLRSIYDEMLFSFTGTLMKVFINGIVTNDYKIIDGKVEINKKSKLLNTSLNAFYLITVGFQDAMSARLSYDGYSNNNIKIENMYVSFSETPSIEEIDISSSKKRGLSDPKLTISEGGNISIQLYSHLELENYNIIKKKRFRVVLVCNGLTVMYNNCKIKTGGYTIEEDANKITYDIEYGYKEFI